MWANIKHIYKEIVDSVKPRDRKIIVTVTIIILACGILTNTVVDKVKSNNEDRARQAEKQEQVWADSEKVAVTSQSNKINIKFSDLAYDTGIVNKMEKAVKNMADKVITDTAELYIEIEPEIIPREAFITLDGTEEEIKKQVEESTKSRSSVLDKVSGIYCRDTYVGQYMSESGQFQSIIAQYTEDKIYVFPRASFENQIKSSFSTESEEGELSEEFYISEIKYCLEGLYGSEWEKNSSTVKEKILKYFTVDCGNDLLDKLNPDKATQVESAEVGFIDIGKSDMKLDRVDIIYVQVELSIEGKKAYMDLELKLNEDNRIFDFDML